MRKIITACICLCFTFSITGCSPGAIIDRFRSTEDTVVEEAVPDKSRVYMDELRGVLRDFNGSQVTVRVDEDLYVFDVSQATLECEEGMITGDEISVIYEGQLNDTDTSGIKALKVVDEYHKKTQLKNRTITGTVQDFTLNTITIKSEDGNTITFPITGTEQYYQNGLKKDIQVTLHYKGKIPPATEEYPDGMNASHLKVLSVSDIDPLKVQKSAFKSSNSEEKTKKLSCVVSSVSLNTLHLIINNSKTSLDLDLSAIPCYFPGGIAEDSHVTITYTGEFNGTNLDNLTILGVKGENPASQKTSKISFRVTGSVIGNTANTVTIRTTDNAVVTFNIDAALNSSTGELETGSSVCITFNPAASEDSNIYTGLKIEDA